MALPPFRRRSGRCTKDSEPLINNWLGEIVRIAKNSGRFERLEITTSASLPTAERALELIDGGILIYAHEIEVKARHRFPNRRP
jgi:hypothetical protein